MARVRMRLLLEWDVDEDTIPEGAEEFLYMMEYFAEKSPLGGFTSKQSYIERNVPEE